MRSDIERVIAGIHERYSESLTLAHLAEMARLSPFHMSRLFHQETGLPPARFLAAVRLEETKRRLLRTQERIADISIRVGYTSIGTFTTRFTKTIGVSPGQYRRLRLLGPNVLEFAAERTDTPVAYGTISGQIRHAEALTNGSIFLAAYPWSPGVRYSSRCRRVERTTRFWSISDVPVGLWRVEALSTIRDHRSVRIVAGAVGPVVVTAGATVNVELALTSSIGDSGVNMERRELGAALPALYDSHSVEDLRISS